VPSNVGLDGVIGSSTEGKWWGGVYQPRSVCPIIIDSPNRLLSSRNSLRKTAIHHTVQNIRARHARESEKA
jgi:hypothetical protein